MLAITNLSIVYGDKQLFRNISARVHPHERVGLVGVNGAGKTTLLKIMAGVSLADDNVVHRAKRATVGYLPQEISDFPAGRTLYAEAETAFAGALAWQEELETINRQLAAMKPGDPTITELLDRQGELQHLLEQSDIFRMRAQIEKVLLGLGFTSTDFAKDCQAFSGGWLMRLMLAKLLLAKPSLLLLDEPTNHLDIESLTWLEEFLKAYHGAMVIISHDRAFLDNLTTVTWELSLGNLTVYKGNYAYYLKEKELRLEIQRAAYENQQAMIQQTKRFVERFRATSTKASQVQSRVKQLEKMELIELEETEKEVSFRFPPAPASGRQMVEASHLDKAFGQQQVFHDLGFSMQRGDKLAVVGVNGAGKSTLAKILAGLYQPDSGTVRFGHNVMPAYFGQHQAQELDQRYTVLDTVYQTTSDLGLTQARSLLGAFLFRGEAVDKKVAVLSGGEKSRLALAKMIATPANLLIMDEPTNHLDISSQEVLQEAMRQYDGSIIVVSHNRAFVNAFVNKVLEIKNGRATLYEGNIDDYLRKTHAEQGAPATPAAKPDTGAAKGEAGKKGKEARREQAKLRQQKNEQLAPLKKRLAVLESELSALEGRKKELEMLLADPELYNRQEEFAERSREYSDTDRRLNRAYDDWAELEGRIEAIEAQFAPE
ncbi:MAG: ATP-binding cassette domain-containing protein [Thermodesulfobacteriota bacterium]